MSLVVLLSGCVSRQFTLQTDPPGARVTIDGHALGTTPYTSEFLSYGARRLELELDGYERQVLLLDISLPWWQVFPLDFVTDLLVPWTIEDHRSFEYVLRPLAADEGTWDDAHAALQRMRDDARGGG